MEQHHSHHHEIPEFQNINRAFYIGIGLNAAFTLVEFIVGYTTNSLALLADASHNLSDVASLIIALIGMKLAQKAATHLYTYGYKKASILASLINSILIMVIVINIIIEGIERIASPPEIAGKAVIITAFIGVIINGVSAFLFYKGQSHDVNIKGAFLHLLVDALVSVGVVVSGAVMFYTGYSIIDPIISFVVAAVILVSTWNLLMESLKLTLDGVPKNVDTENVKHILERNPLIKEIHHMHIWALSSSQNALTVHVTLKNTNDIERFLQEKHEIKHDLEHENIHHATIELDDRNIDCRQKDC